jgi:hypothetical protein
MTDDLQWKLGRQPCRLEPKTTGEEPQLGGQPQGNEPGLQREWLDYKYATGELPMPGTMAYDAEEVSKELKGLLDEIAAVHPITKGLIIILRWIYG